MVLGIHIPAAEYVLGPPISAPHARGGLIVLPACRKICSQELRTVFERGTARLVFLSRSGHSSKNGERRFVDSVEQDCIDKIDCTFFHVLL